MIACAHGGSICDDSIKKETEGTYHRLNLSLVWYRCHRLRSIVYNRDGTCFPGTRLHTLEADTLWMEGMRTTEPTQENHAVHTALLLCSGVCVVVALDTVQKLLSAL